MTSRQRVAVEFALSDAAIRLTRNDGQAAALDSPQCGYGSGPRIRSANGSPPVPVIAGLPLPELGRLTRARATFYAVSSIDAWGRIADRAAARAMRWSATTPLSFSPRTDCGFILVTVGGTNRITRQGHIRLPLSIRRSCHLVPQDRLLLAANPDTQQLVIYTMAAVDAMVVAFHRAWVEAEARYAHR